MDPATMPETFNLRPAGHAVVADRRRSLIVSDDDGVLRALDWKDHEPRLKELLRLQYGAR